MNFAGFRNCLAEYTVQSLSPCYGLITALVLLNSVAKWCNTTQFFTKILHACVHGRRNEFFQGGPLVDFSKSFSTGDQKWWNLVFTTRYKENSIFCWKFKIPGPLPTPICLCVGNVRATPLKNLSNFKRFNTIPNSEILLNLIRKMKYLTNQFQLCFCIGNVK